MNLKDKPVGVCQYQANRPRADWISPWEGRRERELTAAVRHRHHVAKLACARCPLLEECEQMLADHERQGLGIDGVVAGRYTDVVDWWHNREGEREFYQQRCQACKEKMAPQRGYRGRPRTRRIRTHVGEGLCADCWPSFSRAARRRAA